MSVLFFWKGENYYTDTRSGLTYHLNQDSEHIDTLNPGDHIWAFTRRKDKTYVLAADLIVTGTRVNRPGDPGYEYGKYHAEGDRRTSRYFDVDKGIDIEPIIRSLSFAPSARVLGSSFQGRNGVRILTHSDEQRLASFSSRLPTI